MDALAPEAEVGEMVHDVARDKKLEAQRKYRAKNMDKHSAYMRAWRAAHAEEYNEKARTWRAKNPDKIRCLNLRKKHGISLIKFNEMFLAQGSICAICKGTDPRGKNWHVDHCHTSGRIRGILCHHCNLMIGHAEDKVQTLLAAVEYLGG